MNEPALRQSAEERFLHRVLGERLVAEHAVGEPVGDAADAVVELGERRLVRPRDERDERFVREVGEVAARRIGSGVEPIASTDAAQVSTTHIRPKPPFGSPENSIEPVLGRRRTSAVNPTTRSVEDEESSTGDRRPGRRRTRPHSPRPSSAPARAPVPHPATVRRR